MELGFININALVYHKGKRSNHAAMKSSEYNAIKIYAVDSIHAINQ